MRDPCFQAQEYCEAEVVTLCPPLTGRSCTFPASKERALDKARDLPADAIIFDLEDAVAPDEKAAARRLLVAS